jgi:8-oxo-dGTP pyrophosphatase MutT (NUDIX family)
MTPEPIQTATAAGIVYLTGDRVLLLMRSPASSSSPNVWGFPAGGTEEGESPEQTATRESVEETGHAPSSLTLLDNNGTFALFLCQGDVFGPTLNDEHTGYIWAPIDALPEPLHPRVAEQVAMAWAKTQEQRHEPLIAAAMDWLGIDGAIDLTIPADQIAMDKSMREPDSNGWYEVKRNPISKVGIFGYSGRQVGDAENPDKRYRVLRPAEELSAPETLASLRLLPWIDNHVMLGDEAKGLMPAERKGVQGVTGEDVFFEGGTVYSNIKVFSQSMAGLIEAGSGNCRAAIAASMTSLRARSRVRPTTACSERFAAITWRSFIRDAWGRTWQSWTRSINPPPPKPRSHPWLTKTRAAPALRWTKLSSNSRPPPRRNARPTSPPCAP